MSKFQVDNEELKQELKNYVDSCEFKDVKDRNGNWKRKIKKRGEIPPRLGEMVLKIAEGLATKGNWRSYTWREDFISRAVLTVLKYMHNFDYEQYDNAHGYINMICSHAFLQYIQEEKKKHTKMKQFLYDKKDEMTQTDEKGMAIDYTELCDKDWFEDQEDYLIE